MDLPLIQTPIFARYIWMEEVIYSHIPLATMATAFLILAPVFELIGFKSKDLRWDRLARSLVFFAMLMFSPGAALGTGIVVFIIGLYPEFWARWSTLFFWPLIGQFVLFTLEVVFLFFLYYLPWDRVNLRKRRHIVYGFISGGLALSIQAVWDGLGSYTLTPGAPFPAVGEAITGTVQAFFNPSYPFLFFHRFFGNISYSMLLVGGVLAIKYLRAKDRSEKEYYGWSSDITFSLGFLAFFAMPLIGYGYAKVIQSKAPVAFHAMMGGHVSTALILKMSLIGVFIGIAATYLFVRHKDKIPLLLAVTAGFGGVYLILSLHPALDWLGSRMVWRIAITVGFLGFLTFLWRVRHSSHAFKGKRWPTFMLVAGLASMLTFGLGGFVRERSKNPYTVYLQQEKPETSQKERDRFLLHSKCVGCHHRKVSDILSIQNENWSARIPQERRREGLELTDQEAQRIIRYLEAISR